MYKHKTKDGKRIPLSEMEDDHLRNMIKFIEKKAEEGLTVYSAGGYCGSTEEIWFDEETIFGKAVKKFFNYKEYKKELNRRNEGDDIILKFNRHEEQAVREQQQLMNEARDYYE